MKKKGISITAIMGLLILAIIIFAAVKLIIWNNQTVELEDVEAGAYDYESLDYVFIVNPEVIEAHGHDDINQILFLGDAFVTDDSDNASILDFVKNAPDCEVETLTCADAKIAGFTNSYSGEASVWQANCLYDTVKAMCTKDYSLQESALEIADSISVDYRAFYEKLLTIDLDKFDTLYIAYSSTDFVKSSVLYDPNDDYNVATYEGGLRASIKLLQETYPHLRIIYGSQYLHKVYDVDGELKPATLVNYGNGNLSEYVMRAYNIAMECCISYDDNFFGLITEDNADEYCEYDILNPAGKKLIGESIVEYLQMKY